MGEEPLWSPVGDELFYRSGNRIMSVRYEAGDEFINYAPTEAAKTRFVNVIGLSYDVSSDGNRFLVLEPVFDDTNLKEIRIVRNLNKVLTEKLTRSGTSEDPKRN